MLLTLLYDASLIIITLLALPKLLYLWLIRKKYRTSFAERFGKGFPDLDSKKAPVIWIHAVSVGETRAIAPLAKLIKNRVPEAAILVSSVTETGHAEAKRCIPFADAHIYMPFDFNWVIVPIVRKIKPTLVLLCESDFWYNFLKAVKAEGGVTVLVNGKLSEKSMNRFAYVPFFTRPLFNLIDLLCVQNRQYARRFEKIGIPAAQLCITGNIKFDDNTPILNESELQAWRAQLGFKNADQVLVIGSTHDPEEKLFIDVLKSLWKQFPVLKALIVPRHPERFNEVAALLNQHEIPFHRFSQIEGSEAEKKVILMDTMGLLRKCYQIATIAIVAGSYTAKVGGHNIMEPSWYGVPVVFGPEMYSQPELVDLVKEYHAGLQVPSETLCEVLLDLLSHPEKQQALGQAGLQLVAAMHGATLKTWEEIRKMEVFPNSG